jgi:hypothetical protein
MAVTPSNSLPGGSVMPDFELLDVVQDRRVRALDVVGARGTLVMFICNHCPYVVHVRSELVRVAHEALALGVGVVAINANSLRTHPQDGPGPMRALALAEHWRFPFLFDATQDVARAFDAACTPDLYVFDAARRLAYHGQLDDSRPHNGKPVTGRDLRAALAAVVEGKPVTTQQTPSIGCNIKWES